MKIRSFSPKPASEVRDAPEWLGKFMDPRDEQIEKLTQMAQGQIGPDNKNEEVRTVKVRHNAAGTGAPYTDITLTRLRGKPVGLTVIGTAAESYPRWRHEVLDLKKMRLWVRFDVDPGREVDVTVEVKGA